MCAHGAIGAGDFILRLRGRAIGPNSDGKINGIGGDVEVSDEYTPEIDFTYFLTDRFALELIAATARHKYIRMETKAEIQQFLPCPR
jgi:outer membrane protein